MAAKKRFGDYKSVSSREYPDPAATSAKASASTAAGAKAQGRATSVQDPPRLVRELSDKVPFSSRISPAHRRMLADLEKQTGIKVVRLLENALNLLAAEQGYQL